MLELFLAGAATVLGYLYWLTRAELHELQDRYDRLTDRDERGRFKV